MNTRLIIGKTKCLSIGALTLLSYTQPCCGLTLDQVNQQIQLANTSNDLNIQNRPYVEACAKFVARIICEGSWRERRLILRYLSHLDRENNEVQLTDILCRIALKHFIKNYEVLHYDSKNNYACLIRSSILIQLEAVRNLETNPENLITQAQLIWVFSQAFIGRYNFNSASQILVAFIVNKFGQATFSNMNGIINYFRCEQMPNLYRLPDNNPISIFIEKWKEVDEIEKNVSTRWVRRSSSDSEEELHASLLMDQDSTWVNVDENGQVVDQNTQNYTNWSRESGSQLVKAIKWGTYATVASQLIGRLYLLDPAAINTINSSLKKQEIRRTADLIFGGYFF